MKTFIKLMIVFVSVLLVLCIPIGMIAINSFLAGLLASTNGFHFLFTVGITIAEIATVSYYITEIHGK